MVLEQEILSLIPDFTLTSIVGAHLLRIKFTIYNSLSFRNNLYLNKMENI